MKYAKKDNTKKDNTKKDNTKKDDTKKMKRFCVVCGKELEIVLDEKMHIISGGGYWKFSTKKQGVDFVPKTVEEQKEYWECEKCMEDED